MITLPVPILPMVTVAVLPILRVSILKIGSAVVEVAITHAKGLLSTIVEVADIG